MLAALGGVRARRPDAIHQAAHTLKGACQNVGATFMEGVCRALEADSSLAADLLPRLRDAFEPTVEQLRSITA